MQESMQFDDAVCEIHGDRLILECRMCGREFCGVCAGRQTICSDCRKEAWDDDREGEEPDDDLKLSLDDDDGDLD